MKERKGAENIRVDMQQNILRLSVDLSKSIGLTESGKNILIGSSFGPIDLWDGKGFVSYTLSVFKPIKKEEKV